MQLFFIHLVLLFFLFCSAPVLAQEKPEFPADSQQFKILFISSYEKQYSVQRQMEKGLAQVLNNNQQQHEIFYEFMYASRIRDKQFHTVYADYLIRKFSGIPLDYIVVWADDASIFLNDYPELFPDAKRIYLQKPAHLELVKQNLHSIIGIRTDLERSVTEMLEIQQPEKLLLIGSTENSVAQTRYSQIVAALRELNSEVEVEYIVNQPLDAIQSQLEKQSSENTVAFFTPMFSDGKGVNLSPYEIAHRLAEKSHVPIFTYLENLVGSGVVGGYVISQTTQGRLIGEIIRDQKPAGTDIDLTPMESIYDWSAVEKWHLDKDKIPAAAVIVNRPHKLLKEYYPHIIAGTIFIGIQMVLIIFLVINQTKRRRAEYELMQHRDQLEELVAERTNELLESHRELAEDEARFRSLSDATFEGIVFVINGKVIELNKSMARMLKHPIADIVGKDATDFVDPAQKERVKEKLRSNYVSPYETLLIDKDGNSFPVSIHGRSFSYKGQRVRVAAIRDLRELKKAQQEIQTLQGILPICASCKKIRDDSGYWNKIEEYIQNHSDALFSHGLCTDCAEQLYGDEPWFSAIDKSKL